MFSSDNFYVTYIAKTQVETNICAKMRCLSARIDIDIYKEKRTKLKITSDGTQKAQTQKQKINDKKDICEHLNLFCISDPLFKLNNFERIYYL